MPDTFPTPWLNKYNEFHIPHDVPVFDRPLYAAPPLIATVTVRRPGLATAVSTAAWSANAKRSPPARFSTRSKTWR